MDFKFQSEALSYLKSLADYGKHSIIITGIEGIGKTYLASQYSKFVDSESFVSVNCKVDDIKEAMNSCYLSNKKQVVCIENLDKGSDACSQALLKFLEEPLDHVYVIVTCINTGNIPSTILSRADVVDVPSPSREELDRYGNMINPRQLPIVRKYCIYNCCKSFKDIMYVLNLPIDALEYYDSFKSSDVFKQTIDSIVWSIKYFPNKSKTNPKYIFKIVYNSTSSLAIKQICLNSLKDLESKRISEHAVIVKFALDIRR